MLLEITAEITPERIKRWSQCKTNTPKRCPFHYRGLECKSRKSRNTWSNRQIWPWSTEWSRERLIEFCQENALVIANTLFQQHKRRLYTWTSPDGHTEIRLIIFFAAKDGEALYSQQKQDRELMWLRTWTPYCQMQTEIEDSKENHQTIQVWPKSNPLWLYSGSEK